MIKNPQTQEFVEKAKNIHGDKYDYSWSEYINNKTKTCIICPKHGEFWQTPKDHLHGQGCPKCANKRSGVNGKRTNEEFIEDAIKKHGNKYDYSKSHYISSHIPVTIICPEHGEFTMTAHNHLRGQGCPKCANTRKGAYQKSNTQDFIAKAQKVHGDKYDYSKVDYVNNRVKVTIICPIHGEFTQKPADHLHGCGCPECGRKFGTAEKQTYEALKNKYENVSTQYRPKWLHGKTSSLSIDVYLPDYKIGIEYQGRQHFAPNAKFGGQEAFEVLWSRDKRKFELCEQNGVKLFYISFEKKIPNDYFAPVYKTTDELISAIDAYIQTQKPKTITITENMLKQIISKHNI